ncbi:phosphotransferase system IIB component [Bacilli bacterium PM5-9]|nr:phosphotransferase system IIB component [Bacilli bacterium PM5-9]
MDFNMTIIIAAVAIILLVICFFIYKAMSNNKVSSNKTDLPFDINDLLAAIGSENNIIETNASTSKIAFKLNDTSLVDVEKIKNMGASGIVETKDGFTFIFGNISKNIENEIKNKL